MEVICLETSAFFNFVAPQYLKGFNHGYIYEPELAKEITASNNSHDIYFSGLVSGKQEFDMEKVMQRIHNKEEPPKDKNREKGMER